MVPVPQEVAWDFVADARNARRWVFGVRDVEGSLRHPLRRGDRLRLRLLGGGRMADSEWVVEACERPWRVSSRGRALGAVAELTIECVPHGADETEVVQRLSYRLPGGPLGSLAARLGVQGVLEVQAHQSMRALHRLLSHRSATAVRHRQREQPRALEARNSR